jgi:hypothetical protein
MKHNRQKFPFRTPIEVDIKGESFAGLAYFDLETEFPCFAMILGVEEGIVVRRDKSDTSYTRIGWVWLPGPDSDEEIFVSATQLFEEDELFSTTDQSFEWHLWAMVTIPSSAATIHFSALANFSDRPL